MGGPNALPRPDYSNAGASAGFGRAKDESANQEAFSEKKADKKAKSSYYETEQRRDAMTQVGPLKKPRPTTVGSTQGADALEPMPAPGAAQPQDGEASATEAGLVADANLVRQENAQGSLRVGGGLGTGNAAANKPVTSTVGDDFDDSFAAGGKTSTAKREQQAPTSAPPPPPPQVAAAPATAPSSVSTSAPAKTATRSDSKGRSQESGPAELSKLAYGAMRSGDRVREAQFLRQALDAGATGSERLGLLNRLCDAEFAIGRRQEAIEACQLVLEEGPSSSAALMARKRMSREVAGEDDAKPRAGSRAGKAAAMEMESSPAPAPASAPTQAQ